MPELDKAMEATRSAIGDIKEAAGKAVDEAAKMASDTVIAAGDATTEAMDKAAGMAESAKATVSDTVSAVEESASAAAGTITAAAGGDSGRSVYLSNCTACHAVGVAGSPKLGDQAAWAPRIAMGMDALVASVINGKGVMPARGACGSCSDEDIRAAVEYMVAESQ